METRFASILAARSNLERPSELEVYLRQHCQKLSIHEKLSGAHFVFPSASLAVRAYCPINLPNNITSELQHLVAFANHFRMSMVLFIFSNNQVLHEQLHRFDSFFNQAQTALQETNARILLIYNTEEAVQSILQFCSATTSAKTQLKDSFFCSRTYDPSVTAVTTLRDWVKRHNLPLGDAEILIKYLERMETLVYDAETIQQAPVDSRTRQLLLELFHPNNTDEELPSRTDWQLATLQEPYEHGEPSLWELTDTYQHDDLPPAPADAGQPHNYQYPPYLPPQQYNSSQHPPPTYFSSSSYTGQPYF